MSREELQQRQEELLERASEADEQEWSVLFTELLDVCEEIQGATA